MTAIVSDRLGIEPELPVLKKYLQTSSAQNFKLRNHQFELRLKQIHTLPDLRQKRIYNAVAGGLALNKTTASVTICASPLLLLGKGSILAYGSEQILLGIT